MKLLTTLCLCLSGLGSLAQQGETELDPVTVSASLQSQNVSSDGQEYCNYKGRDI